MAKLRGYLWDERLLAWSAVPPMVNGSFPETVHYHGRLIPGHRCILSVPPTEFILYFDGHEIPRGGKLPV